MGDTGQVREALLERHNLSSALDRQVERYIHGWIERSNLGGRMVN